MGLTYLGWDNNNDTFCCVTNIPDSSTESLAYFIDTNKGEQVFIKELEGDLEFNYTKFNSGIGYTENLEEEIVHKIDVKYLPEGIGYDLIKPIVAMGYVDGDRHEKESIEISGTGVYYVK
jgi:hypothetical protein